MTDILQDNLYQNLCFTTAEFSTVVRLSIRMKQKER